MSFITEVAQWFEYLDRPSSEQFLSMFNKQRWKDEKIEFTDMEQSFIDLINGLGSPIQKIEATGLWQYTIPEGYILEWLIIKPSSDCTVLLNDGLGNETDIEVIATHGEPISCMYNAGVDRNISIDALPFKTTLYVKRYKLPI